MYVHHRAPAYDVNLVIHICKYCSIWGGHVVEYYFVKKTETAFSFVSFKNSQNKQWMIKVSNHVYRLSDMLGKYRYIVYVLRDITLHYVALQWRHNDHDGVSKHQLHGCLPKRLFRRRSKKTSKLRVTGPCVGNSPGPVNSPHKRQVTRKMFPFDDVIMDSIEHTRWSKQDEWP